MSSDPLIQMEEKVKKELNEGHTYEAQQFIQSFVARKKKTLGRNKTSYLVFYGAKLLLESGAPTDAGTLLVWFIEDGAGVDYVFNFEDSEITTSNETDDKYCDVQRLLTLLTTLNPKVTSPFIEFVQGPLHLQAAKSNISKTGPLAQRLYQLEQITATIFETTKKWNSAYKAVLRLHDINRLASILNLWSTESYPTEKPLFYARAVLQLLADKKIEDAGELSKKSADFVVEATDGEPVKAALAIWHLSVILAELANLPTLPRVDKPKLFGLLMQLYVPLINQVDSKLIEILEKVGPNAFNYVTQSNQPAAPNPMTLLQNMLAGASANARNPMSAGEPGFDMNSVMAMLNQYQR